MRRITFWILSTISGVALLFGYGTSTSGPNTGAPSGAGFSSSLDQSGSATVQSTPGSSSTAANTIAGPVSSTRWGPVQVQLVVQDGKIIKASVLQYPSGNGKDEEINNYALPILTQETITAQSASIDMVSGATVTSEGYLSSLQSALDEANL